MRILFSFLWLLKNNRMCISNIRECECKCFFFYYSHMRMLIVKKHANIRIYECEYSDHHYSIYLPRQPVARGRGVSQQTLSATISYCDNKVINDLYAIKNRAVTYAYFCSHALIFVALGSWNTIDISCSVHSNFCINEIGI